MLIRQLKDLTFEVTLCHMTTRSGCNTDIEQAAWVQNSSEESLRWRRVRLIVDSREASA